MKKVIDGRALGECLNAKFNFLIELTRYIYRVQGEEAARLDFKKAAEALNTDRKAISRGCDRLEAAHVIEYVGDGLKICEGILKEAG